MAMSPRVYRVGNKNASFNLADSAELDKYGAIKTPNVGWLNTPTVSKVCIHLVVKNAAGLNCTLGAKVSGIDPDSLSIEDLAIEGVDYDGNIDSIAADGEYVLDIVDTSCPFVNPTVNVIAGEADFIIIIGGKD